MEPGGWLWCSCRCGTKACVLTSFGKIQGTETTLVCYNGQCDSLQISNSPTHHRRKGLCFKCLIFKTDHLFLYSYKNKRRWVFPWQGLSFFGKEWQTKIRLDPENFKGSIEIDNRSFSVFFCQNLVCSLLNFSPWPFGTCPVLHHVLFSFPLLVALVYDLTFAMLLNMSPLWLLLYQLRASSVSLPL